ncbi:MAG: hypothetical protein KA810_16460 [Pyrinomonadaceae bacterium]|nr:hypothetical protein [Pyrinomonadaceae bacterium]
MRETSANSDKKMRPPNFFGGLVCRRERSVLFLALEVDVREGVDDLDDAWGEAVAAAFDAHYDARAGLDAIERIVAEAACRRRSYHALAVDHLYGRVPESVSSDQSRAGVLAGSRPLPPMTPDVRKFTQSCV